MTQISLTSGIRAFGKGVINITVENMLGNQTGLRARPALAFRAHVAVAVVGIVPVLDAYALLLVSC